jgi:hypothetical protein
MKNYNKIKILLFLILTIQLDCRQDSNKHDIEKAILELTDTYSQLPKGEYKQTDFYKLKRTVIIGNTNIQLQLRSTPDSIADPQQIIIIINPQGQLYAIPFFSNTYRDYWNFQFDDPIPNVKKTNTSFEKEFTIAIETLNLNDTLGTGKQIIFEILTSLINCDKVHENDSLKFAGISQKNNYELPEESIDSCIARSRKNFEAIKKEIHPSEFYYNYKAYWDKHNERIYQINNQGKSQKGKFLLDLKVYRQDCVFHLMNM